MPHGSLMVFTGNANPKLGADVTRRLGISLGSATVGRFSDGEVNVELLENVRGKDVFVHVSAVERAGLRSLNEGQKLEFVEREERGKIAAVDLKPL